MGTTSNIERVVNCPTLPSLPAVAMRVLELTRDRNVAISSLAETVQTDPALVSKVLKTVNSSYYGLATPCPSIPRAMSMLGLNTVKSIVLGFSLVDFTKQLGGGGDGFDFQQYWRRAVYSGAAARAIARATRKCDPEEAFVGALVADIGMLASLAALKGEYTAAMKSAPEDHEQLVDHERSALGFDHAQIGAELATRWRLPGQLTATISYHHTQDLCQPVYADLVRCVVLGRHAAGSLTYPDPRRALGAFITKAREWFSVDRDQAKQLIQESQHSANELSKLLEIKTGAAGDLQAILSQAQEQMVENQMELQRTNDELARKTVTDALTEAYNRAFFDQEVQRCFDQASSERKSLGMIFLDADRFKSINDTHGHAAGDAVLKELSRRAQQTIGKMGSVCRYGGEEFAIILPNATLDKAARLGEMLRLAMEQTPFDMASQGLSIPSLKVTISVGVSAHEPGLALALDAGQLVRCADSAVYAAKKSGRNRVCLCKPGQQPTDARGMSVVLEQRPEPAPAAPAPGAPARKPGSGAKSTMLIVEDDPLAAKLLELLFTKRGEYKVLLAPSGEKALETLESPEASSVRAIISDLNLPGITGVNLAKMIRDKLGASAPPVVIVSATGDDRIRALAIKGGAAAFFNKVDLCTQFDASMAIIQKAIDQHSPDRAAPAAA